MKKRRRLIDLLVALSLVFYFGAPQSALSQTAGKKSQNSGSTRGATGKPGAGAAHVYLLRGLMNIFSLGMDDLAQKINRAGVVSTVHEHGDWQRLSDEIGAKYKAGNHGPIILIGHSLGADAVMLMGERLGTLNVPVALIVPFDGTRSLAATGNVARVMNITQRDYAYMKRGYGFRGELSNVDVSGDESIGHISIDKSARLHSMVVNKIVSIVGRGASIEQSNASPGEGAPPPTPPLPKNSPVHELQPAETQPDTTAVVRVANATAAAMYSLSAAAASMPVISVSSPAREQVLTPAPMAMPAPVAPPAPVSLPAPVAAPAPASLPIPVAPRAPVSSPAPSSSAITDLEFQQLAPPRSQN